MYVFDGIVVVCLVDCVFSEVGADYRYEMASKSLFAGEAC